MAVAAAYDGFLLSASENPLFMEAISGQRGDLLPIIQSEATPGIERATEGVMAIVTEGWAHVSEHDARLFAECVVRLAFSCAMVPTGAAGWTARPSSRCSGPISTASSAPETPQPRDPAGLESHRCGMPGKRWPLGRRCMR